ncbi:MAG: carbohydrate ABC transporter permease [Inquilinus sp.]|uniref:carbohydrate ABC transporter permease n=1 Tax=Inquilinus sp. TaxID=1932117 RepID=UPI003F3667B8
MSRARYYGWGIAALLVSAVVFLVPFAFVVVTALKDKPEAALLQFAWPEAIRLWDNIREVVSARNHMLLTAFANSTILTVASVTLLVVFAAMVGFVLQRRRSRWNGLIRLLVLTGLIMPPAVVPTIWVMQSLGLFKTLPGLILIEVAYGLSFSILLFRAFIATIPRDLDEAAIIDGAGPLQLFFRVILPLLKPVVVTTIVVQSVAIFNDFTNPLYYLPGAQNATVQLTLYNFQSQFNTSFNLLFMNILIITIPPLVMFLFFNRQIVAGMTAGAVKG